MRALVDSQLARLRIDAITHARQRAIRPQWIAVCLGLLFVGVVGYAQGVERQTKIEKEQRTRVDPDLIP